MTGAEDERAAEAAESPTFGNTGAVRWQQPPSASAVQLPSAAEAAGLLMQAGWDLIDRAKAIPRPGTRRADVEQIATDLDGITAMLRRYADTLPRGEVVEQQRETDGRDE